MIFSKNLLIIKFIVGAVVIFSFLQSSVSHAANSKNAEPNSSGNTAKANMDVTVKVEEPPCEITNVEIGGTEKLIPSNCDNAVVKEEKKEEKKKESEAKNEKNKKSRNNN